MISIQPRFFMVAGFCHFELTPPASTAIIHVFSRENQGFLKDQTKRAEYTPRHEPGWWPGIDMEKTRKIMSKEIAKRATDGITAFLSKFAASAPELRGGNEGLQLPKGSQEFIRASSFLINGTRK